MGRRAHINDPEVLVDLQDAIGSFGQESSAVMAEADAVTRQTLDWLEERRQFWQSEVVRREQAYNACMSCVDSEGRHADCSAEAAALQAAEESLANAIRYLDLVTAAAETYGTEATHFQSFLDGGASRAATFLGEKYKPIVAYLRSQAVAEAWAQEQELARQTGQGSQQWTSRQIALLKAGKRIGGYQGHHIRSVNQHGLKWARDPRNITFYTRHQHLRQHQGNFHIPTTGTLINRNSLIRQFGGNRANARRMVP